MRRSLNFFGVQPSPMAAATCSHAGKLDVTKATETGEWVVDQIRALKPSTDAQRLLQSRALDQAELMLRGRWVVLGELGTAIPWPFLVVLRVLAHDYLHELRITGSGECHRARRPAPLRSLSRR